jgi:hypothetical protein
MRNVHARHGRKKLKDLGINTIVYLSQGTQNRAERVAQTSDPLAKNNSLRNLPLLADGFLQREILISIGCTKKFQQWF